METWKQKLTGYEFMLWDTKRFDIESVLWVKQAFETGLYACAADYIRLYAVHNYGGIYLDMDMEAVKPFDELLNTDTMLARENHKNEYIEAGSPPNPYRLSAPSLTGRPV
jgi:mannosyltransferase OCH1-like enzyme